MLEASNIRKTYLIENEEVSILRGISLIVPTGQVLGIVGPSGSGKSTLLAILGLLDRPTSGSLKLQGEELTATPNERLSDLRSQMIGFVFQSFHLLPRMTAVENVALPLLYRGVAYSDAMDRATSWLGRVGLGHRKDYKPDKLSGGQKQRVAIARALVGSPGIILADEPTGNLDSATAREIMELFLELNSATGTTLVIITHDLALTRCCHRVHHLRDGELS